MSKLSEYYADQIRKALGPGEKNGITKEELMKRLQVTDPDLMDVILKEAGKETDLHCHNGKYFIRNEMPKEVRDFISTNFTIRDGVEVR